MLAPKIAPPEPLRWGLLFTTAWRGWVKTCVVVGMCLVAPNAGRAEEWERGVIVDPVVCSGDGAQSYALYLPSQYTDKRLWPVIYFFDPGANGRRPLERFKAAAEARGYILVGSNNSHNGAWDQIVGAGQAMIRDVRHRLRVDPRRHYTGGLSGGARAACAFAQAGNFAGVIACSAGFPDSAVPTRIEFAFFGTAGREDFNFSEMNAVDASLTAQNSRHRLAIFDGGHEWLPASLTGEVLDWFDLEAMRADRLPRDDSFIAGRYKRRLEAIGTLPYPGEAYVALRCLIADFNRMTDTSVAEKSAATLRETKAVRKYLAAEESALSREQDWVLRFRLALAEARRSRATHSREVSALDELSSIQNMNTPGLADQAARSKNSGDNFRGQAWLRPDLRRPVADEDDRDTMLRNLAASVQRKARRDVAARRARFRAVSSLLEGARELTEQGDYPAAIQACEFAAIIQPDSAIAPFEIAQVYSAQGDETKKEAWLHIAVEKGFNDQGAIGRWQRAQGQSSENPSSSHSLAQGIADEKSAAKLSLPTDQQTRKTTDRPDSSAERLAAPVAVSLAGPPRENKLGTESELVRSMAPVLISDRPITCFGLALAILVDAKTHQVERVFVREVDEDSEAASKGVRNGSEIIRADGVDVRTLMANFEPGSVFHRLFLERRKGERIRLELVNEPGSSQKEMNLTEGGSAVQSRIVVDQETDAGF